MFMGEVAGKRVVVQGIWAGGWVWGEDMPESTEKSEEKSNGSETPRSGAPSRAGVQVATGAPWASGNDRRANLLATANSTWGSLPSR